MTCQEIPGHPFAELVSKFKPNEWQLEKKEVVKPLPLDSTPLTVVDSENLLYELLSKLKQTNEVAISIYCNKASLRGNIVLLAISTRTEDFVIDPIPIKDHMTILNEICVSTDILKVMTKNSVGTKGENRKWRVSNLKKLQRDFGIYLVNLFDLGFALKSADMPNKSLDSCLMEFCGIEISRDIIGLNIDWTERPLRPEVIKYVREDTHYLLSLYDVYRNKLIEIDGDDKLSEVYWKCAASAEELWSPKDSAWTPNAYKNHLRDEKGRNLSDPQKECFHLIHDWRWTVGEESDQHFKDVMPTEHMKNIAIALPTTCEEIVTCCGGSMSELARSSLQDIRMLVLKARRKLPHAALTQADLMNMNTQIKSIQPTILGNATKKEKRFSNIYKANIAESKVEPQLEPKKNNDEFKVEQKKTNDEFKVEQKKNNDEYKVEQKKNNDEYKQCFTCSKYGHISKDCQSGVPWGPLGRADSIMARLGPVSQLGTMGPASPSANHTDILMNALQGLVGNGIARQNGPRSGSTGGRFQPYSNQRDNR